MKHHYTLTDGIQRKLYDSIYRGLVKQKPEITFRGWFDSSDIIPVFKYVLLDHPSLFYVNASGIEYSGDGRKLSIHVEYSYGKHEISGLRQKIKEKVGLSLLPMLLRESNAYEQEKRIYDYITQNTEYSRVFRDEKSNYNIIGPLLFDQSVCEGSAKAFKYLCDIIKLPCIVVAGSAIDTYGHNELHAWNIVSIEKRYYQTDVTWDSMKDGRKSGHNYFNLTDEEMKKDHSWDIALYPKCNTKFP